MKHHIILVTALSVTILSFAGCNQSRTGDYPDNSVNTTRKVDDIKQNSRDQKDVVDAEADRLATRMDFDERQIREKYKADRKSFIIASAREATEHDGKSRGILIQAKHDKDIIDAEVAEKLRTTSPEKEAEIIAEAASRKSEIENQATAKLAPILSESERSKAKTVQRGLEIDFNESKEISALEQERSKVRNETKDKKLKIDKWTNEELSKVAKDATTPTK